MTEKRKQKEPAKKDEDHISTHTCKPSDSERKVVKSSRTCNKEVVEKSKLRAKAKQNTEDTKEYNKVFDS